LRKAAWSASTPINFTGNPGCAPFREERRIKFVNATNLDRNPGNANPDLIKKTPETFPAELRFLC
jgi:hypothetical protein